jgi:hypothetical protein
MTTTTLGYRRAGGSAIAVAAWAMIAGGVLMLVLGIPLASLQAREPVLWPIAALNAFSHLLLIIGVIGLAQSGAVGRGRIAGAGPALTLVGLAVLILAEAIWAMADAGAAGLYYGIATLAMALGLVLAGVVVLRAGRWGGWRRYTVLATGLFIPLVLMPAFALPGYGANYAIGLWGVCWLLIGLSLRPEAA